MLLEIYMLRATETTLPCVWTSEDCITKTKLTESTNI